MSFIYRETTETAGIGHLTNPRRFVPYCLWKSRFLDDHPGIVGKNLGIICQGSPKAYCLARVEEYGVPVGGHGWVQISWCSDPHRSFESSEAPAGEGRQLCQSH